MDLKNFNDIHNDIEKNYLLTGNGFNLHFGYDSSYKNIFEKMKELDEKSYDDAFANKVEKNDYDLEKELENHPDPLAQKALKNDFIKALINIMKNAENNKKQAANFIRNFKKIFTLNYDPFLYKITLHIHKKNCKSARGYSDQAEDLIDELGKIRFPNEKQFDGFTNTEKAVLCTACADIKNGKSHFRKEMMVFLSEKESNNDDAWELVDGFLLNKDKNKFIWTENFKEQNIFYLHGALHIYQCNQKFEKIVAHHSDTLKSHIIDLIEEGRLLDIIFKSNSKEKEIEKNRYMNFALEKLKAIEGNLFLCGVSLSENDKHIWDAIRGNSKIKNIYVSIFVNKNGKHDLSTEMISKMLRARAKSFNSKSIS